VQGGGRVETRHDHRIAMSALVLGLGARAPVVIDDAAMIETSYPTFFEQMRSIGADVGLLAEGEA
jgi:3-phosphoshikimate 1-carboxyvinyltransferase